MYCITIVKPKNINDKYFPISIHRPTKNVFYIKEENLDDILDKKNNLIDRFMPDASNDDKNELLDMIDSKKLPRNSQMKIFVKAAIGALDEYLNRDLKTSKGMFKLPNVITRDAINIYGVAGSGKTYWAAEYMKIYKSLFPDNQIYLITTNQAKDNLYTGFGIKKLNVSNKDMLDNYKFSENDFSNSLVVFDDIESSDKDVYTWIRNLRDMLFQKSRKVNTEILNIIHKGLDNKMTVIPNRECNGGVFFPRHSWSEAKKILELYFDMTNAQIDKIYSLRNKTRSLYICKVYPKYVIYDEGIIILD